MNKKVLLVLAAVMTCVALVTGTVSPVVAATKEAEAGALGIAAGSSGNRTKEVPDPLCEKARAKTGEKGRCGAAMIAQTSERSIATTEQLAADGNLTNADGVKLSDVSATSTIWTKTWWQEKRGLYYINWWEKHSGRIYYHGGHVWSTSSHDGRTGNHTCDQGGGVGYDIRVTSCFTEPFGLGKISEWDYWKVYVFFKGFPLSASHNMHVNAYPSGNLYFHG